MILDKQTLLSNAQAITASAASTNIYDTGSAADIGPGSDVEVLLVVPAAFNTLTSLDIALQCDADVAFGSPKTLWTVNALLAGLTAGSKVRLPCVPVGCERYLRLYYAVNGANPTTGTITAGLILDDQANTPTADGLP